MGELTRTIQQRLDDAYASLRSAHADGDAYLADIRREEISELRRIAANHDIVYPGGDAVCPGGDPLEPPVR